MSRKPYIGVNKSMGTYTREAFWSEEVPIFKSHGERYLYVIGPFRSMKVARWLIEHPYADAYSADKLCRMEWLGR